MAAPTSHTFHITLRALDLDAWRDEFDMHGASDRQVLASIKHYASQHLNEHLDRLGIRVHDRGDGARVSDHTQ